MANIFVGTPNMGTITTGLWINSLKWLSEGKHSVHIFPPQHVRPIPAARNLIVQEFLKQEHDFLLMIDADITPPSNILDMANLNVDVVGAVCFVNKEGSIVPMVLERAEDGYKIIKSLSANSLLKVDAIGTGCIMIKREVFKELAPPYFSYVMSPEGMLQLGEDFNFCSRVKQHGFTIHAHTGFICEHYVVTGLAAINADIMKRMKNASKQ